MKVENVNQNDNQKPIGIIVKIITSKTHFGFKPKREFYNSIGINQKRFGMLCRNQISPTLEELKAVCEYFGTDIKNFI